MKVLQKNFKAFKEWAVVVDALAKGDQVIIFRKGGIDEGLGGFEVEEREFFLFPTYEHQNKEELIASRHARLDELVENRPTDGKIHIQYYATVQAVHRITNLETLLKLDGQHIWTRNLVEERFNWGKGLFLFVLVLRVFRLQDEVIISNRSEFGGCKSWVSFEENFSTDGTPVLTGAEFHQKVHAIQKFLT